MQLSKSTEYPTIINKDDKINQISIYPKGNLSKSNIKLQKEILEIAFPKLEDSFIQLLMQRFILEGFSDKRLIDSVNNVIDNYKYPTPNIADFITFDKSIKLHTYHEVLQIIDQYKCKMSDLFVKVQMKENRFYILKTDYEKNKHLFE